MTSFSPRRVFPTLDSLPRSYFLGHHRAGLDRMRSMLSNVDLIIECRDSRVPITSRNPLFEENLAAKERVIVYTKQDLGHEIGNPGDRRKWESIERITREWHSPAKVVFSDQRNAHNVRRLLGIANQQAVLKGSLLPFNMMVVGMPNVGKSTILNTMRNLSLHRRKAAQTGAQPGITRKVASAVKVLEANNERQGVYLIDTPGVFIPYVPSAESMLKLALCGCVKDTIIDPTVLADYLLFQMNLFDPAVYGNYASPTNDILDFLGSTASRIGRLQKGGTPNIEASALWMIQRWRAGFLGKFVLDEVSLTNIESERQNSQKTLYASLSQGHKQEQKLRASEKLSADA